MEALHATLPLNHNLATLSLVQLIASWVNGKTGTIAPKHVAVVSSNALALS
jgi:uncharacterized protein YbaP (TraB family)